MSDCKGNSSKFLFENRDSFDTSNVEADEGDLIFYEKIEAPKFVDFTAPDHYSPDDRYWFCHRVGCDQKHEEEMDSEKIYKNFVLRVMAARSPNVKLRKALERNCSRAPIKCPLSAPPKTSKPRLTRMAFISSISKKIVNDNKGAEKPLLKSRSTPLNKIRPVAAKYLTTPRNKKSTSDQNAFRSVRNPKPVNVEVGNSRVVSKALVFHSPKRAIKVKTSVELRTPISKLCRGMNKLAISSQNSSKSSMSFGNSLSRREFSSRKERKPDESSKRCTNREAKSGKSVKTKIIGQLSQQAVPETHSSKNDEGCETKNHLVVNDIIEETGLQESSHEEGNNSRLQHTEGKENDNKDTTSEILGESVDHLNANNSSEEQRDGHEFMEGENKENAPASDGNRLQSKQNGRKIFGLHKYMEVQNKNKILKESSSDRVTELKKSKATNPKPFRLRTNERSIIKEAISERRTYSLTPQNETANTSTPGGKLQRKQGNNDIPKGCNIAGLKTPKDQKKSKAATVLVTPESNKHKEHKRTCLHHESSAMQRLEKFRKITSHSVRPQRIVPTKQEMTPGKTLEVMHENSPEVVGSEPREKNAAASRSLLHGKQPKGVAPRISNR